MIAIVNIYIFCWAWLASWEIYRVIVDTPNVVCRKYDFFFWLFSWKIVYEMTCRGWSGQCGSTSGFATRLYKDSALAVYRNCRCGWQWPTHLHCLHCKFWTSHIKIYIFEVILLPKSLMSCYFSFANIKSRIHHMGRVW